MAVSIIIPVYKEKNITKMLNHLLQMKPLEIIVVDGEPTASTLAAIKKHNIVKIKSDPGRAKQMNAGAKIAVGDTLLFLHADTVLPRQALKLIEKAISVGDAGAFDLKFDLDHWWMRFLGRSASKRSRISKVPYGDQAIFIKKKVFEELGGYQGSFMEDVDLMKRLKRNNRTIVFINEPVITSSRRYTKGGLLKTTLKNRFIMILYMLGVPRNKLKSLYK